MYIISYFEPILKGSGLAPGLYHYDSPIEQLLKKRVSTRGPYDLYTGPRIPRDKKMQRSRHLGPGKYKIKSLTQELNSELQPGTCTCTQIDNIKVKCTTVWQCCLYEGPDKEKHGKFSSLARHPMPPSERIHCSTLSQWPRPKV